MSWFNTIHRVDLIQIFWPSSRPLHMRAPPSLSPLPSPVVKMRSLNWILTCTRYLQKMASMYASSAAKGQAKVHWKVHVESLWIRKIGFSSLTATTHRINIFDVDGNPMFRFGGYGDADGKMNCPRHVSVSPKGEILVSDAGNFRVQAFDSQGNFLYKFGEKGNNDGQFSCPAGISTDSEGNMAVADLKNLNVQIFGPGGEFIKKIGQDPDSSKNSSFFSKPTGLAISENGNIAVADRGSHRVQLFWATGKVI